MNEVNKMTEPLQGEIRKLKPNASRGGVGRVPSQSLFSLSLSAQREMKGGFMVPY